MISNFYRYPITLLLSFLLIFIGGEKVAFPMILVLPILVMDIQHNSVLMNIATVIGIIGFITILLRMIPLEKTIISDKVYALAIACLWLFIGIVLIDSGNRLGFFMHPFQGYPEILFVISSFSIWIEILQKNKLVKNTP
jgi:hypothetical protein